MRPLILCLALGTAPLAKDDAWAALAGHWIGGGEVRGMAAAIDLRFRITLDGRGRHLAFENRMTAGDGKVWPFRAEALYLCDAEGACTGHWYDSRGAVLPLKASSAAGRVTVDWGDATSERGRTTYALAGDGGLEITDEVLAKDGAWRIFGRSTLRRAD